MQQLFRHIDKDRELVYAWFEAMHTRIDLVLWNTEGADRLSRAAQGIETETRRIERMGSRFLPDSEVSRINDAAPGCPVCVSEELCALLTRCLDYRQRWGGLFDVTACEGTLCRPDEQRLAVCAPYVTRKDETVRIDFSGCLKGYALDSHWETIRKGKGGLCLKRTIRTDDMCCAMSALPLRETMPNRAVTLCIRSAADWWKAGVRHR